MSTAAVAKATREKARRERLNECFEELARLCDPTGRGVKTDRVSVIADAIRVLTQLRVENNQLRQLNKFLEERVSNLERARAQNVYQQSLLQQRADSLLQQHAGAGMHTGVLAAGPGRIAEALGGLTGVELTARLEDDAGAGLAWLPAPNASEDSKLRPPAA
ncbi:Transcription factor [Auxenochlorella protothecoides]|uniref:Transcription factor n=1 Tax=Auxenochlorella protothecoides TaxID=3075 RepID=A0A087SEA6_AUXPR|nr:Transcription factor [Auxenochlorella protothecoides]KFM24060.1 Transcription factor [Auxenochlorella protothecoides]